LVIAEHVHALDALYARMQQTNIHLKGFHSILSLLSHWDDNFAALRETVAWLTNNTSAHEQAYALDKLAVHPPIHLPRQIFCTIANYRSHIVDSVLGPLSGRANSDGELQQQSAQAALAIERRLRHEPYVCFKLPSTVARPTDPLELPRHTQCTDWELELGVVIGNPCRRVTREQAMRFVAGYTIVNDITVRELVLRTDLENMGTDWLQSKNAPGFLPMGPYFVPADFVPNINELRLTLAVNGQLKQDAFASDMLFDIACQIEYISQHALMLPGDVICTGTPGGCGTRYQRFLKPGDLIEASISGLGVQRTRCVAESSRGFAHDATH